MIIPVALNNIKYRSDINAMNPIEKNVNSLEDYIKLTKHQDIISVWLLKFTQAFANTRECEIEKCYRS